MSSFRFNFSVSDDKVLNCGIEPQTEIYCEEIKWLESEEMIPDKQISGLDDLVKHGKIFMCGNVEICHVDINEAVKTIIDKSFQNEIYLAEKSHSDLIAGKYEGGLKIWECTHDLIQYLSENQDTIKFDEVKVLDLGCGAGILGIYALMEGAFVTFQDYNKEVLEHVTIPNVLLNIEEEKRETELKKCKFYSGDWTSFNSKHKEDELYDIILTSETIYNESNYIKLLSIFKNRLQKGGAVYLAAKSYYFGVGGGIKQFQEAITESDLFKLQICWENTNGILRKILKIEKK